MSTRKFAALAAGLTLALSLTACGGGGAGDSDKPDTTPGATDESAAPEAGGLIGVVLLEQHFPTSAEIHLMAVARRWHRRGVGRALLAATEDHARCLGARLLTVKTLGPSDPDASYATTRAFYEAMGFVPVEEFTTVWPGPPAFCWPSRSYGTRVRFRCFPRWAS